MAEQVYVYVVHRDGGVDDSAFELCVAAKSLLPGAAVTAVVTGSGSGLEGVCSQLVTAYETVWTIDTPALAYPNAEAVRKALVAVLPSDAVVLMAHDTFGMDLAPGLAVKIDAAFVSDVVAVDSFADGELKVVRQEFGGQVSTHVSADISSGAVLSIRAGAFLAADNPAVGGQVVDKSAEAGDCTASRRFVEVVAAEVGDVDITKSEVLVSVGRGIEDQDNLEIVTELAEAMGADVSCSRPIVDAKWMEKSRQVGTSGQTVKPKVYLALGISGSFQHLGGLKGNPFVLAINKNPKAPIFQVADVGVVDDILDFIPELTDRISAM